MFEAFWLNMYNQVCKSMSFHRPVVWLRVLREFINSTCTHKDMDRKSHVYIDLGSIRNLSLDGHCTSKSCRSYTDIMARASAVSSTGIISLNKVFFH